MTETLAAAAALGAAPATTPLSIPGRKAVLPPIAGSLTTPEDTSKYGASATEDLATSATGSTVIQDTNGSAEAPSSVVRKSSDVRRSFKDVGKAIKVSLRMSSGFNTLRDMTADGSLDPACLKPVRKLGEGAFAVVEEALYTPPVPTLDLSSPTDSDNNAVPPLASESPTTSASGGDGANGNGTNGRTSSGQPLVVASASGKARAGAAVTVAVKRLKPEIVNHEQDLQSFLAEAALMRKLHHKRIVQFIGVGSTDPSSEEAKRRTMFLVQEFMDGGTLKKVVSRQMIDVSRRLYSCADAFRWGLQVAEGLEYLHAARPLVIHRDLKLENILMKGKDLSTADAKIADFGLVALVRPRARAGADSLRAAAASTLQRVTSRRGPAGGAGQLLQRLASRRGPKPATLEGTWDDTFRHATQVQMSAAALNPPQQLSGRTGSYM
ncbi:hypothetical protein CHLRE_14g623950v5 [Chlamydomonas reinhardtii]|uniref:Protein kinase domain-containing protein n=1 Tax=Chlamydomonas reinhardtii TaxID=3055 RepID=A0A2K3CY76_CHLRE|nr:uncharacterized protein CHLRE_14g623950v5 [Chlamydomonas reinhardtii]XP_042916918.1 uncharacterized protein CHLRE_14g623950v5 [Chlamydomonas reinhardtii]PNW73230.1 hypothetical protein CHLRE_14g623950v5 [Chlamydomonas reinhardtii]PNW73231.1 hypothetical protein CHLRE_14g623950v5 [Chlamydomonas reinhardtii]